MWGSGLDPDRNVFDPINPRYAPPPGLKLHVHAIRGPRSRAGLLAVGTPCPAIYGDPGWLLPEIIAPAKEKTHDLGVVVHQSELAGSAVRSRVQKHARYEIGSQDSVRIISTLHEPTWAGFARKVREITSCRRIVSTSFHGLIVPEAYGIPSLYFPPFATAGVKVVDLRDLDTNVFDHRIIDFYTGCGRKRLPVYNQNFQDPTDWHDVMRAVDDYWERPAVDVGPFLDAFPLKIRPFDRGWRLSKALKDTLIW